MIQLFVTSHDLFPIIYLYSNTQRLIHQTPRFIISLNIIKTFSLHTQTFSHSTRQSAIQRFVHFSHFPEFIGGTLFLIPIIITISQEFGKFNNFCLTLLVSRSRMIIKRPIQINHSFIVLLIVVICQTQIPTGIGNLQFRSWYNTFLHHQCFQETVACRFVFFIAGVPASFIHL